MKINIKEWRKFIVVMFPSVVLMWFGGYLQGFSSGIIYLPSTGETFHASAVNFLGVIMPEWQMDLIGYCVFLIGASVLIWYITKKFFVMKEG